MTLLYNVEKQQWENTEGPIVPCQRVGDGNPLNTQVGGDHYKKLSIQPVEFILANNIPFCEGSAIKYIVRWKSKGGIQDLEKAKHYLDILIDAETRKTP